MLETAGKPRRAPKSIILPAMLPPLHAVSVREAVFQLALRAGRTPFGKAKRRGRRLSGHHQILSCNLRLLDRWVTSGKHTRGKSRKRRNISKSPGICHGKSSAPGTTMLDPRESTWAYSSFFPLSCARFCTYPLGRIRKHLICKEKCLVSCVQHGWLTGESPVSRIVHWREG
jgi:hypothetical protein